MDEETRTKVRDDIQQGLRQGESLEKIREVMRNAGYSDEEINLAFAENAQTSTTSTENSTGLNMKVMGIIIVIAVLLIMVFIIGSMSLVQTGVFNPSSGGRAPGQSGFGGIRPAEWSCSEGTLYLYLINGLGQDVSDVKVDGMSCDDTDIEFLYSTECYIKNKEGCVSIAPGNKFEAEVSITYTTEEGAESSSLGVVWGEAN